MRVEKEQIDNLPDHIGQHLRSLLHDTDLPDNEESFRLLAAAWVEKESLFSEQTRVLDMQQREVLEEDDPRGALLLTSSGSLLSLWPAQEGKREMEYSSIHMRSDVPDVLRGNGVVPDAALEIGRAAKLHNSPLKKTSSVYKIAVCDASLEIGEQEKRIREATIFLTNGFARINKKTQQAEAGEVEHFNKQTMVAYIAKRGNLTQRDVKQVLEDYLSMVETGILLGETIQLGRLGRISLKNRPPQKARVGRNPATGEEMTIPAKPAQAVPRISFSSYLKERAAEVDLEES